MADEPQPPVTDTAPGAEAPAQRTSRERARLAAATVLAVVITLFAVFNLDQVKVHWVVATSRTPLIVVIAICLLLGVAADRVLQRLSRRRAPRD